MIDKIPDNFLMEVPLSSEQEKVFIEQINRFNKLSMEQGNALGIRYSTYGDIIFKKGTLIHGTNIYDKDKLDSISKSGILTGQAVGRSEDCETYYCADFHRVVDDTSITDYSSNFERDDIRCPFGKGMNVSRSVAFVIEPNDKNKDLLAYDCYRDGTYQSDVTKTFINFMPISPREKASSILYGVPANCFQGIVVGCGLLDEKENIYYLMEKFPNCYIVSSNGDKLYDPKDRESVDVINIRVENAKLHKEKRLLMKKIDMLESDLKLSNDNYNKLMYQVLMNCNNDDIAQVLISLGFGRQSKIDNEYVNTMRNRMKRNRMKG